LSRGVSKTLRRASADLPARVAIEDPTARVHPRPRSDPRGPAICPYRRDGWKSTQTLYRNAMAPVGRARRLAHGGFLLCLPWAPFAMTKQVLFCRLASV